MMNESDMIKRVFLLGILKKEPDETLDEVTNSLVNTGMFDMREAKQVLQELKEAQYIVNEQLSIKGIAVAQEAEAEFKLQ
jgi:polyhydroxyalkanoate synthesis regulator phasin